MNFSSPFLTDAEWIQQFPLITHPVSPTLSGNNVSFRSLDGITEQELDTIVRNLGPCVPIDLHGDPDLFDQYQQMPLTPRLNHTPPITHEPEWSEEIAQACASIALPPTQSPLTTRKKPVKVWSAPEQVLLLKYGDKQNVNWGSVARMVEGDVTAAQCKQKFIWLKKRGLNAPKIPHRGWSKFEISTLMDIKLRNPNVDWSYVSNMFGRSVSSCKLKYRNLLAAATSNHQPLK